jgi:hypothetical protein
VPLSSFDHRLTHRQSTGSHDACGCISTPMGAHVCSAMGCQTSFSFLSFVHRQSQLASQGPVALAEKLTQSLRNTGDLDFVEIDLQSYVVTSANVARDFPNSNRTENHLRLGTMTKSCFRRRGALNLLNRLCSLFVYPS